MFSIIKNVILNGRFELSDMLRKIDTLWVQGSITDTEKSQLINLARENADPEMSMNLTKRMDDMEKRLKKIEENQQSNTQQNEKIPDYIPNRVYYKGDRVYFEGKNYECILDGSTDRTTWSPSDYPDFWKEIA